MQSVKTDRYFKAAIGVLLVALVFVIYDSVRERVIGVGDTAPDFRITTDSGRTISAANFGGKLLVLNFWATWCPPCIEEMPSLDQFQKTLAAKGVVVLGISVDKNEQAYKAFLSKAGVSFRPRATRRPRSTPITARSSTPKPTSSTRAAKWCGSIIGPENWTDENMLNDVRSLL